MSLKISKLLGLVNLICCGHRSSGLGHEPSELRCEASARQHNQFTKGCAMFFSFPRAGFAGLQLAAAAIMVTTLSACGGGGSGASPASVPPMDINQGVYIGTLSGGSVPNFELLVLEDGSLWALYGVLTASSFMIEGFVQGQASFEDGNFTSNDLRDFGGVPSLSAQMTGRYDATPSIAGQITSSAGTVSFSGAAVPSPTYQYHQPALLSDVRGSWGVALSSGETASLSISDSGALLGVSSSGCHFNGQVRPRPSGKNVFNVSVTSGSAPCDAPGQTVTGVALTYPLANGSKQLVVVGTDAARSRGFVAYGSR